MALIGGGWKYKGIEACCKREQTLRRKPRPFTEEHGDARRSNEPMVTTTHYVTENVGKAESSIEDMDRKSAETPPNGFGKALTLPDAMQDARCKMHDKPAE